MINKLRLVWLPVHSLRVKIIVRQVEVRNDNSAYFCRRSSGDLFGMKTKFEVGAVALKLVYNIRRGVRVAERAGLENRYTGNRIEGSNPSLSAFASLRRTRSATIIGHW